MGNGTSYENYDLLRLERIFWGIWGQFVTEVWYVHNR